ncbi:MAG: hypothetical protein ACIAXF_11160 [Phycisphaerales bacterium JB063]
MIAELCAGGWQRNELIVPINNANHVAYKPGFPANESTDYCLWHQNSVATSTVRVSRQIGEMNAQGVKLIAAGLVRMEIRSPNILSPKNLKKIKALI